MLLLTLRSLAVVALMAVVSRLGWRSDSEWLAARPGGTVNQTPPDPDKPPLSRRGSTSGWFVLIAIMGVLMCGWLLFVLLL